MPARKAATGRRAASKGGGKKMGYLPKEQLVKPGRVTRAGEGAKGPEAYQENRPDKPASEGISIPGF